MGLFRFFKRLGASLWGDELRKDLGKHQRAADALDCAVKEILKK